MKTRAIILKKQNTNEYDQLVTCYTEEFGKVTGIAKSILKPSSIQAMHLDIFNLAELEFINGLAMPIITGAQAEETFPGLKNNLVSLAVGYFFTEAIDKLSFEYQKDDELWNFLLTLTAELNNKNAGHGDFLKQKQVELLDILGYSPNLKECTFCSRVPSAQAVAYNAQARGIVCAECFLSGMGGIVIKNRDFLTRPIINSIFESLAEKKLHSLNLINSMLE
jgi:DNA repair protein RecO (recombination protein O)